RRDRRHRNGSGLRAADSRRELRRGAAPRLSSAPSRSPASGQSPPSGRSPASGRSCHQPEPPPPPPPPPDEPPPLLPEELESWLEPELEPLVPGAIAAEAIRSERLLLTNSVSTAGWRRLRSSPVYQSLSASVS